MKNLELLKVPELIDEDADKAFHALTVKQSADVAKKLDDVTNILMGNGPHGCYRADERMRDAVTSLAAVIDEYGYKVVRRFGVIDGFPHSEVIPLLLTVYLNLPEKEVATLAASAA